MKPLRIEGLTKEYVRGLRHQRVVTLDRLSLEIEEGEVFGFLGHNGAGKTTTIKLVLGLLRPTSGSVWIMDQAADDAAVRRHVGYLPESPYFYEYLTTEEFLLFIGKLFGLDGTILAKKVDELLELVSMNTARHTLLGKVSKGMLQRVGIAQALINDPEVVILDEPMSGLDPIGRRDMRDIIHRLKDQGKTIFFSSHILPDVEMVCDRIGILVKGSLKAVGTVRAILGDTAARSIEIVVEKFPRAAAEEAVRMGATMVERGHGVLISVHDENQAVQCLELIRSHNSRLISYVPHKKSLEDLFLQETGLGRS